MLRISEVNKDKLARLIQDTTPPIRNTEKKKNIPVSNLNDLTKYILADPSKAGLPVLDGLYQFPIVTPDGSLLTTNGYDAASRLYLSLPDNLPSNALANRMSPEEALAALKDLYSGFLFIDNSDFVHTLAMALTMILRPYIKGVIPVFSVLAAIPGSGKTLLTGITSAIVTNEWPVLNSLPKDEPEMQKTLLTVIKEGKTFLAFDNVDKEVNSNVMEAFVTSRRYSARLLGTNESGEYNNNALIVINGNNTNFAPAMARRVVPIRLEAIENPHLRNDFKHKDIKKHILETQPGLYLNALLSIISAWLDAGAPIIEHRMGSFEEWSSVIGGIFEFIKAEGFLKSLEAFRGDSDAETSGWNLLVNAWFDRFKGAEVTPTQIVEIAKAIGNPIGLAFVLKKDPATALGYELRDKRNRIYGGLKIAYARQDSHSKSQLYRLEAQPGFEPYNEPQKTLSSAASWGFGL